MTAKTREKGSLFYFVLICVMTSFGGFLFGFDTAVISGAISPLSDHFDLENQPVLLGWVVSSVLLGSVIGAACSGVADYIGRKKTLIFAAVLFTISALGSAIAEALWVFILFRLIGGLGVGIAAMVVPLYISEVSPANIRGRMVAMYQLSITFGVLIAYFSNDFFRSIAEDFMVNENSSILTARFMEDVWRLMLGSELIPAVAFLIFLFLVPLSPRYAVSIGQKKKALAILSRINGYEIATKEVQEINESLKLEKGTFSQLFQVELRKPTFIALFLAIISQLSGIDIILHYGPLILERGGLSFGESLDGQIIFGMVLVVFTTIAMWQVDRIGRRKLLFIGNVGVVVSLLVIGFLFHLNQNVEILLIIAISFFIASFSFSLGPIPWIIMSEIFPTKIRGRAMALGTLALFGSNWFVAQMFPWVSQVLGENGTFWLLACFSTLTFPFVMKVLPETKGKTLEEIESHWRNHD
ncbi:MAG: sugar porter family MFS transporter [Flavobacteriaceae bacterium]|nr:sugar porter family MFS transporter [Flavobacteriaceae bacterium]MCY4267046.1 sugar porter family MFS transporter [Flavobacteriaceae bacterium]